jgi:hypothetical protein
MKFNEIGIKPKLIRLYQYNVDDEDTAYRLGMKKDRQGQFYLYQYNTSGSGFIKQMGSARRIFGNPIHIIDIN